MKKSLVLGLACLLLSACAVREEIPNSTILGDKLASEDVILVDTSSSFYPIPSLSLEEALFLVESDIRASFYGEHDNDFLRLLGRSLEDSDWRYQSTVGLETWVLLGEIWSEYPDENTEALAREVLQQMFKKLAFRVDSAVFDQETEDILVRILISPMGAPSFATLDFVQNYFYQVIESEDVLAMDLEDYVYFDNLASQGLLVKILDNSKDMSYGKEEELYLRLAKKPGGYQVDVDDWHDIRNYAIDYAG